MGRETVLSVTIEMNYKNTFILVADDCPVECGVVPVVKAGKSKPIHVIQYELISEHPYYYTQEDILFMVFYIIYVFVLFVRS